MDGNSSHDPFEGNSRVSAILIALFLSLFAIGVLYVFYRQFNGGWERPGVISSTFERMLDPSKKPILWDVYIGKENLKWEWTGFKSCSPSPSVNAFIAGQPLSGAVLDTISTLSWTPKGWQEISKEEEETVYVSTIIVFPSQRRQQQRAEVEDYAIGVTGVRCRGLTPHPVDLTTGVPQSMG